MEDIYCKICGDFLAYGIPSVWGDDVCRENQRTECLLRLSDRVTALEESNNGSNDGELDFDGFSFPPEVGDEDLRALSTDTIGAHNIEESEQGKALMGFAAYVLARMELDEDWGADTLEDIARYAINAQLAGADDQGYFKRIEDE